MTVETLFEIPHHGSYIYDIGPLTPLLMFKDAESHWRRYSPHVEELLLSFFRAVYAETTPQHIYAYTNKCFTIVGEREWAKSEYVVLYRHDWTWSLLTIPKNVYHDWATNRGYCAPVPETLPQY